jgi:hypothetical protein
MVLRNKVSKSQVEICKMSVCCDGGGFSSTCPYILPTYILDEQGTGTESQILNKGFTKATTDKNT